MIDLLQGMEIEHTKCDDSYKEFKTTNYHLTTTPSIECEFVYRPIEGKKYPGMVGDPARKIEKIETFLDNPLAKRAGLRREEALALRLYTGKK